MYPAGNLIKLAPSDLSASAHTAGDVVFTKAELKNAVPSRGGCSLLVGMSVFVEGAADDDDFTFMFFDNDTALGEPSNDPGSDITADEFRAASCIGSIRFDGTKSTAVGNGLLYNLDSGVTGGGRTPVFVKSEAEKTSIWVACISHAGTLDLTDTDSMTLTFGFQYLG